MMGGRLASRGLSAALLVVAVLVVLSPLAAVLAGSGLDLEAARRLASGPAAAGAGGLAGGLRGELLTTLEVAALAAATALVLGAPFALLVGGARAPLRRLLLGLSLLVLAVPPYLAAAAWIDLLGPVGRLARPLARLLGFAPTLEGAGRLAVYEFSGFVYTWPSAGIVLGACFFPLVALATTSADRRLDRRVLEAARLARGRWGVLRTTLALLGPSAGGGALLVFAVALGEFAVPQVLRVRTLGDSIYDHIQEGELAAAAGLALPLVGVVLVAGVVGALALRPRRVASGAGLEGEAPSYEPRRLGLVGKAVALALGLLVLTPGLLFPLASLTLQAAASPPSSPGPGRRTGSAPGPETADAGLAPAHPPGWSAAGDVPVTAEAGFAPALARAWAVAGDDARRTALLAALTATLACLVAGVLGRFLARPRRSSGAVTGLLLAGLAVPAPLVGLGLIALWNREVALGPLRLPLHRVYDGSAVVVLGWLARFFPVALLLARASFRRVPPELEQAAALAGRPPGARLRGVVLPLAAPGLVAAWLAVYVLSATEFGTSVLVVPPGRPLLAVTVVNLVHYGQDAGIAACCLVLLGTVALPIAPGAALALWLARRTLAGREERG